jgi:membrane protease YdiL (CAAX protease family)
MSISGKYKSGIRFTLIILLWSWGVLAIPVLFGLSYKNFITTVVYILAGASPSVIGLIFVFRSHDRKYIRSFLKRLFSLENVGLMDLMMIFLLVPALTVLSVWINCIFTNIYPDWSEIYKHFSNPGELVIFVVFTFVFGPLAEEIGWRGYLLDCWRDKGILMYGAGIGFIWTIWHLPMFFISGTYQNSLLSQGALSVICFVLSTTSLGIIIGKLVQKTQSILIAFLFHFTINFTGEVITLTTTSEIIKTSLFAVIAVGVLCCNLISEKINYGRNRAI